MREDQQKIMIRMRSREEEFRKDSQVCLRQMGMWNLAPGTYLFIWLKQATEQHGGCVGWLGWQGKKTG